MTRPIFTLAALATLAGCGTSQEEFATQYAAEWCELAVECPVSTSIVQFDLSSVEACRDDVEGFYGNLDDDNCSYDSGRGDALLDTVTAATCDDYEAAPDQLAASSVFPCDNTVN